MTACLHESGGAVKRMCDCDGWERDPWTDTQTGRCDRSIDGPGGPLDCTLPAGHDGRHQDRTGATWTP